MKLFQLLLFLISTEVQAGFFFNWFQKSPLADIDTDHFKKAKETLKNNALLN